MTLPGKEELEQPRQEMDARRCEPTATVPGKRHTRAWIDAVWNVEKVCDVRELRPLLQA